MKSTLAIITLVASGVIGGSCAAPAPTPTPATDSTDGYFNVMSARSGSPIHLLPMNARSGKFYIGGPGPTSYCPVATVGDACPPGNTTVLSGGNGGLSMGVIVPGGQQVYVATGGALSYTIAHAGAIPAGAVTMGFSRDAPVNGQVFGYLNFETGFVACPAASADEGYQVFGQVQGSTFPAECLSFSALAIATDKPGAWSY